MQALLTLQNAVNPMPQTVSSYAPPVSARSLLEAQDKAQALFDEVVRSGLITAGKLESELSTQIFDLARERFGVSRHWHKRVVRAGENTMMGYYDEPAERRIEADDVVYLDFGPVFEAWEADFGRTYALGSDPVKHRLVADIGVAFERGKAHYRNTPALTAGGLYDYVVGLAAEAGWEFGAVTAGHLVGHFPHERDPQDLKRFSIRNGNGISLREPDANGNPRHWILEIHFIDRQRRIGGFFEELLTVDRPGVSDTSATTP
jgi:Xaa-Pro dipeptidase